MLDIETGELTERRREHANGEARTFYSELKAPVRVGIEDGWDGWPRSRGFRDVGDSNAQD
jgi:hypothetical protein